MSATDPPIPGPLSEGDGWKLYVDDTPAGSRQKVDGFGAAWTDAAVACLDALPADLQQQALAAFFGPDSIQLRLMRHTVGQSDLTPASIGEWSYDSNSNLPDPTISNFTLGLPGKRMTSWLRRMRELDSSIKLFGSTWSPPQWMKQNNSVQLQYADAWARYMLAYVNAFAAEGVRVDALTPQNEPLHSSDPAWTTLMQAQDEASLINALGSYFAQSNLSVSIWAYDHNTDRPDYPETVFQNAGQYVNTVAWHCYSDQGLWQALSDFHAKHPNSTQYMTECWLHLKDEGFFELSDFVIGPLQNWASGALAWTIVGSTKYDVSYPGGCDQCSGLMQVDRDQGVFELTQDYFSMGQFSKFVDPQATYQLTAGSFIYPDGTGVQTVAFMNPNGDRVVVIQNKIRSDLPVQLSFSSGQTWHATVPARSVTTWVFPAASNILDHIL